jgi:hypothetical protein
LRDAGYAAGVQFDLVDNGTCVDIGKVKGQDPPAGFSALPRTGGPSTPPVDVWIVQRRADTECI